MGQRETPAHAQAVLLPPRPAARRPAQQPSAEGADAEAPSAEAPPPASEHTLLRPKELPAAAAPAAPAAGPAALRLTALPAVEPRTGELAEQKSPSVPPLPVAALERPSENRSERTPSPVPRVSLVPPTGRIDASHLAELSALESRNLPTIAPRLRASSIPPAPEPPRATLTIPLVPKAARPTGLVQRLMTDVRTSKREIALGLVIGIVLSFVLGKVGQSYLESRGQAARLQVRSFANEPAPPVAAAPPSIASPAAAAPSTASPVPTSLPAQSKPPSAPGAPPVAPARKRKPAAAPAVTPEGAAQPPHATTQPGDPAAGVPLSPAQSAGLGLELPL